MWTGRPVSVERTRRCDSDLWVVKRRNSGAGGAIVGLWHERLKLIASIESAKLLWIFLDAAAAEII